MLLPASTPSFDSEHNPDSTMTYSLLMTWLFSHLQRISYHFPGHYAFLDILTFHSLRPSL